VTSFLMALMLSAGPAWARSYPDPPPVPVAALAPDLDPGVERVAREIADVYSKPMSFQKKIAKMRKVWLQGEAPFDKVHDSRGMGAIDTRAQSMFEELFKAEAQAIAADDSRDAELRMIDIAALQAFADSLPYFDDRFKSSIHMHLSAERAKFPSSTP
jgi:hypothetical protein